jgi:hypothetical protein
MFYGIVAGCAYAVWGFGECGEPPLLNVTAGPLRQGILCVHGRRIHHWEFYMCLVFPALWLHWFNTAGFCAVMVLHGLSYEDAFDHDIPKLVQQKENER